MPSRVHSLDLLRGICALAVLGFHYFYLFPLNGSAEWDFVAGDFWQYGYLGVPVFFMVSGFVIAWSAQSGSRRDFLLGRATRLLPTLWVCLALTCAALWASGRPPPPEQIAANLIIVARWWGQDFIDAVYWTLVIELLFYAAVWSIIGGDFRRRILAFGLAWLGLAALNLAIPLPLQGLLNPLWAPYFCVGIFAFLGRRNLGMIAAFVGERRRGCMPRRSMDAPPARWSPLLSPPRSASPFPR
jgi:peptidoglycan/LPS O-acetylase OafA/YrhL